MVKVVLILAVAIVTITPVAFTLHMVDQFQSLMTQLDNIGDTFDIR